MICGLKQRDAKLRDGGIYIFFILFVLIRMNTKVVTLNDSGLGDKNKKKCNVRV